MVFRSLGSVVKFVCFEVVVSVWLMVGVTLANWTCLVTKLLSVRLPVVPKIVFVVFFVVTIRCVSFSVG